MEWLWLIGVWDNFFSPVVLHISCYLPHAQSWFFEF